MTVDLEPVIPLEWLYDQEEYGLTFILDSMPLLDHQIIIGETTIVIHWFGGTYGPTRSALQGTDNETRGEIRLTLPAESGIPIGSISFSDILIDSDNTSDTDGRDMADLCESKFRADLLYRIWTATDGMEVSRILRDLPADSAEALGPLTESDGEYLEFLTRSAHVYYGNPLIRLRLKKNRDKRVRP